MRHLWIVLLCACAGGGKVPGPSGSTDTDDAPDTDPPLFEAVVRFGPGVEDGSWVAFDPCGPRFSTARPVGDLRHVVKDPGTGRLWGLEESGRFWRGSETSGMFDEIDQADSPRMSLFTWDPIGAQLVGQRNGAFWTFTPDAGPWVQRADGPNGVGSGGTLLYDPTTGGYLSYDHADLHRFGSTFAALEDVTPDVTIPPSSDVQLRAGAQGVWAVQQDRFLDGELYPFDAPLRVWSVDPSTGVFEAVDCAASDPPPSLHVGEALPSATSDAPPGEALWLDSARVVSGTLCGALRVERDVPERALQVSVDPTTGERYLADSGGVYALPVSGEPVALATDPSLPEISWVTGITWSTRDAALYVSTLVGEGFLYRWSKADGWSVLTSTWNHDIHALTWRPDDDRLYALDQTLGGGRLTAYLRNGAIVAMRSVPAGVVSDRTQLRAMDDVLVAFHPDGIRYRIVPETGETTRIECP